MNDISSISQAVVVLIFNRLLGFDQCQNRVWWDWRDGWRISRWHAWIREIDHLHIVRINAFNLGSVINMAAIHVCLCNCIDTCEMRAVRHARCQAVERCAGDHSGKRRICYDYIVKREFACVDHFKGIVNGVVFVGEAIVVFIDY